MTDTNMLLKQTAGDTSGSDLLRVWSQQYGGDVAIALGVLKDWLAIPEFGSSQALVAQYATPAAAATVNVAAINTWLILTPAGTIAALTIVLPAVDDDPGVEVLINTTQQITALTVNLNGASGSVGVPSTLAAGGRLRLRYDTITMNWFAV